LKDHEFRPKPLLTKREQEVFDLLVQDKTTKEIAQQLFISEKTVRNHISNTMQKLGVKGRSQAVIELVRLGYLKI
jgi:LuxR family transcriptional regulator, transcriptional regulator of spore coat protein